MLDDRAQVIAAEGSWREMDEMMTRLRKMSFSRIRFEELGQLQLSQLTRIDGEGNMHAYSAYASLSWKGLLLTI
jgi:hypothetical protein